MKSKYSFQLLPCRWHLIPIKCQITNQPPALGQYQYIPFEQPEHARKIWDHPYSRCALSNYPLIGFDQRAPQRYHQQDSKYTKRD